MRTDFDLIVSAMNKLEKHDADAERNLLQEFKKAADKRFADEGSIFNSDFWYEHFGRIATSFMDGFGSMGNIFNTQIEDAPRIPSSRTPIMDGINDDMRAAVCTYMNAHGIKAADIGLDEEEIGALKKPLSHYYQIKNRMPALS